MKKAFSYIFSLLTTFFLCSVPVYAYGGGYYDYGSYNTAQEDRQTAWIVIIIVPLFVAGLVCFLLARKNKTKGIRSEASFYINRGGVNLTQSADHFIRTTRVVTPLPRNDDMHGGRGPGGPHGGPGGPHHGGGHPR